MIIVIMFICYKFLSLSLFAEIFVTIRLVCINEKITKLPVGVRCSSDTISKVRNVCALSSTLTARPINKNNIQFQSGLLKWIICLVAMITIYDCMSVIFKWAHELIISKKFKSIVSADKNRLQRKKNLSKKRYSV